MKKTLALALALLLALSCLAGCHGKKGTREFVIPETFDTEKSYELTFWAKNDTNVVQVATYEKAAEDFHKLYPNVTVHIKFYTDYARLYNDVITNVATDTTPNVCITYPDHIATYQTGGDTVVSLDALMADAKYGMGGSELRFDGPSFEELIPKFIGECKIGDAYYALPFMRSTEAMYVNKTYVEKLGFTLPEVVTWDFVFAVAEAAMEKEADGETYKINGQKTMIPFIYKSTDNMMIQMVYQKGIGYSDENGKVALFSEETASILKEISIHAKSHAFSTFKISSYPANFLNAGQCIFAVDSTAGATWMGSKAPLLDIAPEALVDFETVVMPIPQYDTKEIKMISQGPSICVFNKEDPQEVLASWLFAQFLLTDEVQLSYSGTEGYAPVTSKAQQSAAYQDYLAREGEDADHYEVKIQATRLLLDNTDKTFVTPVFNGSASLRDAAGQLIEEVTNGVRRDKKNELMDPATGAVTDAYIQTVFDKVTSLYHLDQIGGAMKSDDLGPLPKDAKILLAGLAGLWVIAGTAFVIDTVKKKTKKS